LDEYPDTLSSNYEDVKVKMNRVMEIKQINRKVVMNNIDDYFEGDQELKMS